MAVITKKQFPNAVGTNGQSATVFSPVDIQLNNQDDLDVYVTLSGGTRVLQLRQASASTAIGSGPNKHPQVNNTDGLYFPAVSAGTTLYNYQLSTDNNTITFSTALPTGATVFIERRTRDADSSYTTFASGSTIRATDLNNSSTESNFTAQDGRNKAFTIEGALFRGDQPSTNFVTTDHIVNDSVTADKIPDDTINSEHYVAGSIDLEHMSANSVDSDQYVDGSIDEVHLSNSSVTSNKIADNAVTTTEILNGAVTRAKLEADAIDGTKLADNAVDSEHYTDGSIDRVHLEADIIDSTKLADNAVNSEHYVDGSIDRVHLEADIIDSTKLADNAVGSEHIQTNAVTDSEIATGTLDNRYFTETELTNGALDGRYFTETESDARYFNVSTGDTIKDGDTFPDNDTTIATTAAINDRIIDLVDDVGGFVPIANETSFPTANPDVNNGSGTLVSIKSISSTRTPSSGTVTIANGAGTGNTVSITGCGSTVLTAGFGIIVETTSTLHTYSFHRLVPKATEVTTVAGISSNVTTVATNIADINTVAADLNEATSEIDTVATNIANVNTVGNAIANVNTTAGSIANVNTTAGSIANVNNVGNNISNVNAVAGNASNINSAVSNASNINSAVSNASNITTVAGAISNVNTTAGSISNVNTVASNISNVNSFFNVYRIGSNNPTSSLDVGDLFFNTTSNSLKVYTGSAWVDGVTATGNFAVVTGNTFTGSNNHNDAVKSIYGGSNDLQISHENNNNIIRSQANSGHGILKLLIDNRVDFKDINDSGTIARFNESGNCELYFNNSKKLETTANGVKSLGTDHTFGSGNDNLGSKGNRQRLAILGDTTNGSMLHIRGGSPAIYFDQSNGNIGKIYQDNVNLAFHAGTPTSEGINILTLDDNGDVLIPNDNKKLKIGATDPTDIYNDGNDFFINHIDAGYLHLQGNYGVLLQRHNGTENLLKALSNGAVELLYDNNKKFETTSTGAKVTGIGVIDNTSSTSDTGLRINHSSASAFSTSENLQGTTNIKLTPLVLRNGVNAANAEAYLGFDSGSSNKAQWSIGIRKTSALSGDFIFNTRTGSSTSAQRLKITHAGNLQIPADDAKLQIGESQDLQIYHGSGASIIQNSTGPLRLQGNDLQLANFNNTDTYFRGQADNKVELYFDNSKKLETTSTGATVSGNNFIIQDTGDVTLTLASDTDNSDETHCPTINFNMDGSVNVMKVGVEGNGGDTFTGSSANRPYILTTTGHGGQPLDFGTNNIKRLTLDHTALVPASNNTYDLGTTTNKWREIYVNNFNTTATGFVADGTEFKFSHTNDVNVIINADTDNSNESHHPSLSFLQDGVVHVLDVGVNGDTTDYTGGTHNHAYVKVGGHGNVGLDIATSGSAGNAPTKRLSIDHNGHIIPGADSSYDIGTNTIRFRNIYGDTYYGDGSNLTGINTDLVSDTSPQLGGTLDTNGNVISFDDATGVNNNRLKFGTHDDLHIYHNNVDSTIRHEGTGKLVLQTTTGNIELRDNTEDMIVAKGDAEVELYYNNSRKLTTHSEGITIPTGNGLTVNGGAGNRTGDAVVYVDKTNNNDWTMKLVTNSGSSNDYGLTIQGNSSAGYLLNIHDGSSNVFRVTGGGTVHSGHVSPRTNNTFDLGGSSTRWRNVYTNDLHLSNEGSSNDVDGTWGDWTIQEGESDLFLKNNRSGKKYKFNLMEVS